MKIFALLLLVIIFVVWQSSRKDKISENVSTNDTISAQVIGLSDKEQKTELYNKFKCDGRTHCSQMNSCEEATFFLKNCPGVKMDGNNDGIPCEKQWCH